MATESSRPVAIVAEDEPLLAAELHDALVSLWPELHVAAVEPDGVRALAAVDREAPAVAFLDIEMPRMNGLDVARRIGGRCHVVFVTAFDRHAIEAFEAGAIDYVLKPIQMARLASTIQRLRQRLDAPPPDLDAVLRRLATATAEQKRHLQWVSASRNDGVRMIMVGDICYFKADHKYTLVVEEDCESLIRKTIRELADELDPSAFWQVHRSTLVNVSEIKTVVRDERGMHLKLKRRKETLIVSEPYYGLFRQM